MRKILMLLILLAIVVVGGYYAYKTYSSSEVQAPEQSEKESQKMQANDQTDKQTESEGATSQDDEVLGASSDTLRETGDCQAKCRDQYSGSGSAGFEACVRSCGEGSALREACPEDRPACPEGQPIFCRYGKWICLEEASPSN